MRARGDKLDIGQLCRKMMCEARHRNWKIYLLVALSGSSADRDAVSTGFRVGCYQSNHKAASVRFLTFNLARMELT